MQDIKAQMATRSNTQSVATVGGQRAAGWLTPEALQDMAAIRRELEQLRLRVDDTSARSGVGWGYTVLALLPSLGIVILLVQMRRANSASTMVPGVYSKVV